MTPKLYNETVKLYADGLYRFLWHMSKDEEIAKDVVQDSFERLWNNKEKIQEGKEKSYLFTVAYRRMLDVLKKEKRISSLDYISIEPHSYMPTVDFNKSLQAALDALPTIQKTVVLLRDLEGYTYKEIAELTDLSEAQVKVYIFRARVQLKQLLGKIENVI